MFLNSKYGGVSYFLHDTPLRPIKYSSIANRIMDAPCTEPYQLQAHIVSDMWLPSVHNRTTECREILVFPQATWQIMTLPYIYWTFRVPTTKAHLTILSRTLHSFELYATRGIMSLLISLHSEHNNQLVQANNTIYNIWYIGRWCDTYNATSNVIANATNEHHACGRR